MVGEIVGAISTTSVLSRRTGQHLFQGWGVGCKVSRESVLDRTLFCTGALQYLYRNANWGDRNIWTFPE